MISTQALKVVPVIQPVSIGTGSGTSLALDTQGWNYITFVLSVGVTTGAITVFKVQESSDNSADTYADVTGATLTTLPGAGDDGKRYAIHLNKRDASIERYLKVVLTEGGTGSGIYGVDAILGDPDISPNTAAERGFTAEVIV